MAERLGATLVELPDVGHSPAVDAPDAVADAIAALYVGSLTAGGTGHQRPKRPLETPDPHVDDLQRQSDGCGGLFRRPLQHRRPPLRQPDHPRVVPEVVVAQVRVAVEAELDHDAAMERRGKEVGEQIGAWLLLQQFPVLRRHPRRRRSSPNPASRAIPYRSQTSSSAP